MSFMRSAALGAILLAAACTADQDARSPLGDFRLGHNVVMAKSVQKGPFSREASAAELTAALSTAIERRLDRYDGNGLYHLGVSIGGYVLAQPGLPVVYTPKSVLIFDVTVYDNATQQKLNAEPRRFTVFEGLKNIAPVVGSGNVRGKEEQLSNLAEEGAKALETWLRRNPDWFVPDDTPRTPFDRAAVAAGRVAAPNPVTAPAAPRQQSSRSHSSRPIVDPVAMPVPANVSGNAEVPMMAAPGSASRPTAPAPQPAPAPAPAPEPAPTPTPPIEQTPLSPPADASADTSADTQESGDTAATPQGPAIIQESAQ
ncbi:hypothetical protein [Profundibacterium mesophilum]|uniref:Adhesin n=1 Tax=Profundibacterium mesophilum KAUST100406-0324 TaxID=1037889 RepID=A0A921TEL2_9RHOB|nr:hypothetical protein [Profundibacterium mesophilum]KAF0675569.1 adhesin [Profundibacterium mesophilum KAUST100406-0324]